MCCMAWHKYAVDHHSIVLQRTLKTRACASSRKGGRKIHNILTKSKCMVIYGLSREYVDMSENPCAARRCKGGRKLCPSAWAWLL